MLKLIVEIYDFDDLYDNCWGQALKVLDEIREYDKEQELMAHLEDVICDESEWSLTTINDYISYDWEEIYQAIDMEENDDD